MIQFCANVQKPYFCPFLGPFCPKSREQEFSQIWDFRRNHVTLHFRSFLAKTNDSIFAQKSKNHIFALFLPFLGRFCPKSREREFSQIWDLRRKLANHNKLHFRSFLAKSNDSILRNFVQKPYFWAFSHFRENENFPEKSGPVTFLHLWSLNFMQKNRKN